MARRRSKEKERFWRDVLRRRGASNVTLAEFCKREGVSPSSLAWWRKRILDAENQSTPKSVRRIVEPAFVELDPAPILPTEIDADAEAVTRSGLRLRFGRSCLPDRIRAVLDAARSC